MRASRQLKASPDFDPGQMPEDPDFELQTATLAELNVAGRLCSASGKAAMALAKRIDMAAKEPGSSLAAMVREHRAALADALSSAQPAADPVEDELRAARERRRAVASS